MITNYTPEQWSELTTRAKTDHMARAERPYHAANGHTMVRYPKWMDGRPVYSSAWTVCADNCAACGDGETLPDW